MLVTTADTVKDAQNTIYSQLDKQKQKASSTEQISEARQLSKDIRKSDAVAKHDNGRRGEKTRTVSVRV